MQLKIRGYTTNLRRIVADQLDSVSLDIDSTMKILSFKGCLNLKIDLRNTIINLEI